MKDIAPTSFRHKLQLKTGRNLAQVHRLLSTSDKAGPLWNDPDLGIAWPVDNPTIAARDAALPRLKDIPRDRLPSVAL